MDTPTSNLTRFTKLLVESGVNQEVPKRVWDMPEYEPPPSEEEIQELRDAVDFDGFF